MNSKISSILLVLSILLAGSCSNSENEDQNDQELFELNLEESHQNKRELKLSEIASEIEYVFLETNPNCLVDNIRNITPHKDILIVISNKSILLFDRKTGKFIREIGEKTDKGPKGYFFATTNFPFNSNTESIYTHQMDIRNIREFSLTGEVIKDFPLPFGEHNMTLVNNNTFVSFHANSSGQDSVQLHIYDQNGETLYKVPNDQFFIREPGYGAAYGPPAYYKKDKQFFYYEDFHDTVYALSRNGIRPHMLIQRGKLKPPYLQRGDPKFARDENPKYLHVLSIFELQGSIISVYVIDKKLYISLYDIENKESASIEKLPLQGFTNDIDGLVPFFPSYQSDDEHLIGFIDGFNFYEWSQDHPQELKKFKNLPSIDENMNPLVMIVTPKGK